GGESEAGGERRGTEPGDAGDEEEGAVEEGEAVLSRPAEDLVPGDGAAVRAADAELVEGREDADAADEGAGVVGELAAQEGVERALLRGGDGVVAGALARVVAGSPPSGAPGSGIAGREPAGEEASVDGALWGVECLGDLGEGLAGLVAAGGIGEVPGHGGRDSPPGGGGGGDAPRGPRGRDRSRGPPRGAW